MRRARIPLATYRDEVAAKFRPDKFDAREWVRVIKAAGMSYIIITAKHHDGFAIWPSAADPYNIKDVSHFNRDPLRELVDAARAQGLHVGFYYSHAFDWAHPDAPGNDWDYDNPAGDKLLHGGKEWWTSYPQFLTNTDRYIQSKVIPQLQELISRYHPDIIWFDTPSKLPFFQQAQIVKAVRAADPNVVINGRGARGQGMNLGDYQNTADRPAELRPTEGDWEAIPTTNESYGWNKLDLSHKPPSHFIQLLAKAEAKGGNILLNIGPRGDGTLDPPDVAILKGIGDWMRVNGESVRGTQRTPLDRQSWGDSTVKGERLFLHVLQWPPSGTPLVVGGLQSDVRKVYVLKDSRKAALKFRWTATHDLEIDVPKSAPDEIDSVLVVESAGPVRGAPGRLIETRWGTTQLLAFDADAQGKDFSYGDGKAPNYYVEGLEREGNALQWSIRATRPADLRVTLRYRTTEPGTNGAVVLEHASQSLRASLTPTTDTKAIQSIDLGKLHIEPGALSPLTLKMPGPDRPKTQIFEIWLQVD
jgi:alpha-L-fucosidase